MIDVKNGEKAWQEIKGLELGDCVELTHQNMFYGNGPGPIETLCEGELVMFLEFQKKILGVPDTGWMPVKVLHPAHGVGVIHCFISNPPKESDSVKFVCRGKSKDSHV